MSYEIDSRMGGTMESEKQYEAVRQTIASQFMDELESVRLLAAKVSEETSERLASVMLAPSMYEPEVEKCAEAWPPLFNDARSKVDDIEASLRRIDTFLRAAEL